MTRGGTPLALTPTIHNLSYVRAYGALKSPHPNFHKAVVSFFSTTLVTGVTITSTF